MLIFNQRLNSLVSKYIVPLKEYGIPYSKLRQNALRSILTEKPVNIIVNNDDSTTFYFNKDDLLKALDNDISLFYIRTLLQREAARNQYSDVTDKSTNWSIVTDYYYAFFLGGLLLRLCHKGTFYFDNAERDKLRTVVSTISGKTSCIGNNCYFIIELNDTDREYTLNLYTSGSKTHELVWERVSKLMSEITSLDSETSSDEYTVLKSIIELNKKMGATFPSQLRNKVNYRPHYGLREVDKEYHPSKVIFEDANWLYSILSYDGKKTDDDQKIINLFAAYVRYIQALAFNLLNSYDERRGRGSGILSSINKNRNNKITQPTSIITYH